MGGDQAPGRSRHFSRRQENYHARQRSTGEPWLRHRSPEFRYVELFTNQVLAQIELFCEKDKYDNDVYVLSKHLDEKVARLHLQRIGANLTSLSNEQREALQAEIDELGEKFRDHVEAPEASTGLIWRALSTMPTRRLIKDLLI